MDFPHMMTIKETAKQTKLAENFIRKLVLSKTIPYVKAGCKYLLNANTVADYLNNPQAYQSAPQQSNILNIPERQR